MIVYRSQRGEHAVQVNLKSFTTSANNVDTSEQFRQASCSSMNNGYSSTEAPGQYIGEASSIYWIGSTSIAVGRTQHGFAAEQQTMSAEVIRKAFAATEEGFTSVVAKNWDSKPQIAAVGSCCLVGVICAGMLYVANAGDSRVVLAKSVKATKEVAAVQLSEEHNACIESVRQEMRLLHPEDSQIVVLKHNVWRVKGIIQVSRSIGDVYLKKSEFNREPLHPRFRLSKPFKQPILSADPSILVHKLEPSDKFLIFASDGLWEHLSNQEAVDIVQNYPRNGIARRLVKAAMQEAAKKREMRYSDLKKIDRGVRRHFHDDITVVVVFLDHQLIKSSNRGPAISIKGGAVPVHANSFAEDF